MVGVSRCGGDALELHRLRFGRGRIQFDIIKVKSGSLLLRLRVACRCDFILRYTSPQCHAASTKELVEPASTFALDEDIY